MKATDKKARRRGLAAVCAFAICGLPAPIALSQSPSAGKIIDRMEKDGCVLLESQTKVCKYDYEFGGKAVEAISFRPAGAGPFPGVLLIPGYKTTARDLVPAGIFYANQGFAFVAVTQPGFGKSQGPPDFVGPKTLAVLTEGYRRLRREPYVDPARMGIFGYSRGAMAASLLAVQLDDLRAVVLGAGIYDFQRAYDDATIPEMRENMRHETGMTRQAVIERSSILRMDRLKCPVLILHGERDVNVPVSQALLLRDRLTQLHKDFEIRLFPDRDHHSLVPEVDELALDFFRRRLLSPAQAGPTSPLR